MPLNIKRISKQGKEAEDQAKTFIEAQGYTVIAQNFLCKGGEIDIIATCKNALTFIEVRFRKTDNFGMAQATVSHAKQKKISHTAQVFLQAHPRYQKYDCRFDVIAMTNNKLDWIKNAFYTYN